VAVVTLKQLLEAGVHFGHQTRRWNPKMKPFHLRGKETVFTLSIYRKLMSNWKPLTRLSEMPARKVKTVLFVGTKRQAQEPIREEAEKSWDALCESTLDRWIPDKFQDY